MTALWLALLALGTVVAGLAWLRLHPFLAMMLAAFAVAVATPEELLLRHAMAEGMSGEAAEKFAESLAPERVMAAFGRTCGQMGLLIAFASIIGRCLLDSGGALRIVRVLLALFGVARMHIAFVVTGFTLAIPVYFDAVFYLLMPIGKAMARTTGRDYLLYVLTIVAGATMAHSLVPPTPGPVFAAKELDVPLAKMMVGGLVVGLFTAGFGLLYAIWINKRTGIELPREDAAVPASGEIADRDLPPLWAALLPVVIPLGLIGFEAWMDQKFWWTHVTTALAFGAASGLLLLRFWRMPGVDRPADGVQSAIMSGASILLITASGGALGSMLRQTDVAGLIQQFGGGGAGLWALVLVFGITALVRTAQGSATVAMITAAPIAKAFAVAGELGYDPLYLALAVGCGSKPIPWLNDSGFWVITRMTGMREWQTLKLVTPMMSLMGLAGLPVVVAGAWLFPLW